MRNYKTKFTSNEQTLAASTSFAVASANTFAAARRRFCESESSSVSASALIPVTNDDDACYKVLTRGCSQRKKRITSHIWKKRDERWDLKENLVVSRQQKRQGQREYSEKDRELKRMLEKELKVLGVAERAVKRITCTLQCASSAWLSGFLFFSILEGPVGTRAKQA